MMIEMIVKLIAIILSVLSTITPALKEVSVGWQLNDIPAYVGGVVCENVYNGGCGMERDFQSETGTTESDSKMQLIYDTDLGQYVKYCRKLIDDGYSEVYTSSEDELCCGEYEKDGKIVYAYYSERTGETRVIEDFSSESINDFGYTYSQGSAAEVYQFSFPYYDKTLHNNHDIYSSNGMLYIIKLADNSLMVIDGGSGLQSTKNNLEQCMNFMRRITGAGDNGKVKISLWFGTHPHGDHATFFSNLIKNYKKYLTVERVMFNYVSYSTFNYIQSIDTLKNRLKSYWPGVVYLKPHTGMKFDLANLKIKVLYTQEDCVDAKSGTLPTADYNNTSTVLKITAGGKTLLILGDSADVTQERLLKMYTGDELQTDVLQAAHHMFNNLTELYALLKPEYIFASQSMLRSTKDLAAYKTLLKVAAKDRFLFADQGIYGLKFDGGKLTLTFEESGCKPYDG